jgi:hypothetical protein
MEKKMFRFYQEDEKSVFKAIVDGADVEAQAKAMGAKKLTILSVSELIDEHTNKDLLSYKGPLYFDIDCKEDLQSAIDSTRRLVSSLLDRGTEEADIHLYCSGSKGLHVLVSQKAFSNGRATKRLPTIYKEMAKKLFVTGLDYSPYASGHGNAFRIAGMQRYDGNYRTPITHEELADMDAIAYKDLCAEPRDYRHPEFVNKLSTQMELLYEGAKQEANRKPSPVIGASNSALKKIAVEPPNCINDIAEFKKIATDKSVNYLVMQFAIWAARAEVEPAVYRPVLEMLAQNSATKNTNAASRIEELESEISYMRATPNYEFSCGGMRSALVSRPCEGCPIECNTSSMAGNGDSMGVARKADGFYLLGKEKDTRITTFTLSPTAVVVDYPQDGSAPRRLGTLVTVEGLDGPSGEIMFRETGWQSASSFKAEMSGLGALAVVGGDDNVQRIKHLIYTEAANVMNEIKQVYTAGVHLEQHKNGLLATYVEPSYSLNSMNLEDTYRLQGQMICPPHLKDIPMCKKGDKEADKAMAALCAANHPLDLAHIVGWFAAAHLKEHLRVIYSQFPLLQIWGSAGSGKSKTVELLANLCGIDSSVDAAISVSSITPYAVLMYAGSSTTVPRIMEELNKSKMRIANYNAVTEILKSAWGSEAHARGTLSSRRDAGRAGGSVTTIPVTGPCVTIAEQTIEVPAVEERSIKVLLTKSRREGCEANYWIAREGSEKLREISKFLVMSALLTPLEEVKQQMEIIRPLMPKQFEDRPRYSHAVIQLGLNWLHNCLLQLDLPDSCAAVKNLIDIHLGEMAKVAEEAKSKAVRSEIDSVIETMGYMAMLSSKTEAPSQKHLEYGVHFTVTEDHIIVEPSMAYIMYKRFKNNFERETPVINSVAQFVVLLQQEPYYDGTMKVDSISKVQACFKLSKVKMLEKSVDPAAFCEDYL